MIFRDGGISNFSYFVANNHGPQKKRTFDDVRDFQLVPFGSGYEALLVAFHDRSTWPLMTLPAKRRSELESLKSELQRTAVAKSGRLERTIASPSSGPSRSELPTLRARFQLIVLWSLGAVFFLLGIFPWRDLSLWFMARATAAFRTVAIARRK